MQRTRCCSWHSHTKLVNFGINSNATLRTPFGRPTLYRSLGRPSDGCPQALELLGLGVAYDTPTTVVPFWIDLACQCLVLLGSVSALFSMELRMSWSSSGSSDDVSREHGPDEEALAEGGGHALGRRLMDSN
jgi:hypothetical protein